MRSRILTHGAETLADYELLEALLFYAIPRKDTKPLAKQLLAHFGSMAKLLQASDEALKACGLTERIIEVLRLSLSAARFLTTTDDSVLLHLGSSEAVQRYLKGTIQHVQEPKTTLLCLDGNNHLLAEVDLSVSIGESHKHIAHQLLKCHATAVIIVFYHPRSPATALAPEVRGLKQALRALSIIIHEAILVSNEWHFSMGAEGLL